MNDGGVLGLTLSEPTLPALNRHVGVLRSQTYFHILRLIVSLSSPGF